jgi:hypothetical protein
MMRTFGLLTVEDTPQLLDLIVVDPDTGEIAFGTGAGEELFDELAPVDVEDLNVDDVIGRINDWSNDLLTIIEMDTAPDNAQVNGSQVASLVGTARDRFNELHKRLHGRFAPKGTGATPSAAAVKGDVKGDSGGIEHVAHDAPVNPYAPDEVTRRRKAQAEMDRLQQIAGSRKDTRKQAAKLLPAHPPIVEGPGAKKKPAKKAAAPSLQPGNGQVQDQVAERAKRLLARGEIMHGSDRSKWSKKDQESAKRLEAQVEQMRQAVAAGERGPQRIERGAVAKAIATGQPDALAGFHRRQLSAEAKRRGIDIKGKSDQEIRDALVAHGKGAAAPAAEGEVAHYERKLREDVARNGSTPASRLRLRSKLSDLDSSELKRLADHMGVQVSVSDDNHQDVVDELVDHVAPEDEVSRYARKLRQHIGNNGNTVESRLHLRSELSNLDTGELKKLADHLGVDVSVHEDNHTDVIDAVVHKLAPDDRNARITAQLKAEAKRLGIDTTDMSGPQVEKRIQEVQDANAKPHTTKLNAHSLTRGDMIMHEGEPVKIEGNRQVTVDGKPHVELDVVGKDGKRKKITLGVNQPTDKLAGGSGGSGTFAAVDPVEFALSGGELDDFNHKHPRGFGGKFGHLLAHLAGVGEADQNTGIEFDPGPDDHGIAKSFDWDEVDPARPDSEFSYLKIRGPVETDLADPDTEEPIWDEGQVHLHMTDGDYESWGKSMSAGLLRRELTQNPLPPNDPRSLYIESMLDLQDAEVLNFDPDANPWHDEQYLEYSYSSARDEFDITTSDEDGDELNFSLTPDEFKALHAQVMRHVGSGIPVISDPQKVIAGRARNHDNQTAALEYQLDQLDYNQAMAQWAANQFDISTMPEHLQRYWTEGEGAAKVRWKVRGAFKRARRLLLKEGVPLHMVDGTVANLYRRATGTYPHPHGRRNRTGPGRMSAMGTRIMLPMQTACATCGNDQMAVDLGEDWDGSDYDADAATDTMPDLDAPSTSMGWRGPLAPIDVATGDRRQFAQDALASRKLPLPFRWQEAQRPGHDGAVVVGALTGYSIADDGTIMGEGYFLDPNMIPEAGKAMYLVQHQLVGPSVDLEPNMDVSFADETGQTFDPHDCQADGSCPAKPTAIITAATVAGATLVPITAFAEARAPELFPRTVRDDMIAMGMAIPSCPCSANNGQVASVRANGWDDLPFADRETPFDKNAAVGRLADWATADGDTVDLGKYGQAFLWKDDVPADQLTQGSFKLPIADVVDGELTIIPRAVFAVAARLNQTGIPASAKQDVKDVLDDLYGQMADEFGDDTLQSPFESTGHEMAAEAAGCGCAEKWAHSLALNPGSQTAASVWEGMEPYPADAFKVKATAYTPMTIEERPGEGVTRIYGHIGSWSSCNRGMRGVCVPPPRSRSGYKEFHLGVVRTTEGNLPAGKIVMGEGHADVNGSPKVVRAFYDATSKQVAFGRMYDDEFGPFFSGVLAPGVSAQDATTLMMSPPSGHWTNFELMAILAVNVPGHAVPRAHMVGNQMANMVAAGRWFEEPQLADLEAIAREMSALAWEQEAPKLIAAFAE